METPHLAPVPQRFETGRDDYERYEADGEFAPTVVLPGFDTSAISLTWDGGVLNIAAQHQDEGRGRRETNHRRFPLGPSRTTTSPPSTRTASSW